MELNIATLQVLPSHMQDDPSTSDAWEAFAADFPEVLDRHVYFVSLKESYQAGEELIASYGREYARTYASHGFERPPPTVRVPPDTFRTEDLRMATWPMRVPAWWNLELQPLNRPTVRFIPPLTQPTRAIVSTTESIADSELPPYWEIQRDHWRYRLARSLLASPQPPSASSTSESPTSISSGADLQGTQIKPIRLRRAFKSHNTKTNSKSSKSKNKKPLAATGTTRS